MKSLEEFIDKMVNVNFIEDSNCFGHYPFQMFVENKNGTFELNSLALGGNAKSCYQRFAYYKTNGAKRIYMSLDFPKYHDIENDFVAIFSIENDDIKIIALPYTEKGQILDKIEKCKCLDIIKEEFEYFTR